VIIIARKTKLTDEIIDISVENVKNCLTQAACAQAIGISYETWRTWLNLGREGKEPYARFYIRIQEAEADLMKDLLKQVKKRADMGDLPSIIFILERRFSSEWGRTTSQNVKMTSENVNLNYDYKVKDKRTANEIRNEILKKLTKKTTYPPGYEPKN
jgi:hypothetical protein